MDRYYTLKYTYVNALIHIMYLYSLYWLAISIVVVNLVEDITLGIHDKSGYNLEFCCASLISNLSSSLSLVSIIGIEGNIVANDFAIFADE